MAVVESASIRPLDEAVVNRIAAGEVVQRPANALKELLENSLDAGASNICVTVRDGGLKLLSLQDNGCGIRREDMCIVCERFTTSKLTHFEDLLSIGTFGFRGEALASISHVARLTITTRTKESRCSYRATYVDGRVCESSGGIRPCAGNIGTQIVVEDLFYNMAARRQALRSVTEEFNRVADVVSRYAVHNAGTAFSLRKHGDTGVHVRTSASSTVLENIRVVWGGSVASQLQQIHIDEPSLRLAVDGYISGVNHAAKRFTMILFINGRLVESTALRRALELVYSAYLPRGCLPFVYLSLRLPGETVDVNVHPTKNEVHFLNEDRVLQSVQQSVDSLLVGSSSTRSFFTQTLLPGRAAVVSSFPGHCPSSSDVIDHNDKKQQSIQHPKQTVRTDYRDQKLDRFVKRPADADKTPLLAVVADQLKVADDTADCQLASVISLRADMEKQCDAGLRELLVEHSFVGAVNWRHSLVQHATRLYLVNHNALAVELFRQLSLYQLGSCGRLLLSERPSVVELALLGLELPEAGWSEEDGSCQQLAEYVARLLSRYATMLDEYFSVGIDENGCLYSLPLLLPSHQPSLAGLPLFVVRLATEIEWTDERECICGLAAEIGRLYGVCAVNSSTSNATVKGETILTNEKIILSDISNNIESSTADTTNISTGTNHAITPPCPPANSAVSTSNVATIHSRISDSEATVVNTNVISDELSNCSGSRENDVDPQKTEPSSASVDHRHIIEPTDTQTTENNSTGQHSANITAASKCSPSTETRWFIEHVLLPACKQQLLPPVSMAKDGTFLQLANLPDLYKIFERC